MIARAVTSLGEIKLEFPYGIDINEVLVPVNNALSRVPGYPENVDEPRLVANSSENPFMFFSTRPLPGNPQGIDMIEMRDFLEDNVRVQLERVQGVPEVTMYGGAERQVKIYVGPVKLVERRTTLSEVRNAIRAQTGRVRRRS